MDSARARRLEGLLSHPLWADLEAEVEDAKRRYFEGVTRSLMGGVGVPANLDYERGRLDGMRWLVERPHLAQKVIEKAQAKEDSSVS